MTEIYEQNLIGMEVKAYHSIYDMLSSYAKNKIDATKPGQLRNQRIVACHLLENSGAIIDEQTYLPKDNVYKAGNKFYSMSHSRDYVCVALSDGDVGIDVEDITRTTQARIEKLKGSHFFTDNERAVMAEGISVEEFLKLWTFKEAYAKVCHKNLVDVLGVIDYFDICNLLRKTETCEWKSWCSNDNEYYIRWIINENYIICVISNKTC